MDVLLSAILLVAGAVPVIALPNPQQASLWPAALGVFAVASAISVPRLLRIRIGERAWRLAGLSLVATFSALAMAWTLAFDSQQGNDFGVYFRCGTGPRWPIQAWIDGCQSATLRPSAVYWSRSLFSIAPVGLLFGPDYPALKLWNALLYAATLTLVHWGTVRTLGAAAAFVVVLLLGAYPELWFSLTLATPDNVALPLIVVVILLMARLADGTRFSLLLAVGLGLLIFMLEQARTVGTIVMAALVLAMAAARGPSLPRALAVIVAFGTSALLVALMGQLTGGYPAFPATLLDLIAAIDLSAPQGWMQTYGFIQYAVPVIPAEHRMAFELAMIRAEWLWDAGNLPHYLLSRATDLFGGSGYAYFATADLAGDRNTIQTAAAITVPAQEWLAGFRTGIARSLIVAAAIGALRRPVHPLTSAALCWSAAFLVLVIIFGEVQPRYSVLAAPALAILAAGIVVPSPRPAGFLGFMGVTIVAAFAAVIAAAALAPVARLIQPYFRHPLMEARTAHGTGDCDGQPTLRRGARALTIALASDSRCGMVEITVPGEWKSAGWILTRPDIPFRFEHPTPLPVAVTLTAGNGARVDASLGGSVAVWRELDLSPGSGAVTVRLERGSGEEGTVTLLMPLRLR